MLAEPEAVGEELREGTGVLLGAVEAVAAAPVELGSGVTEVVMELGAEALPRDEGEADPVTSELAEGVKVLQDVAEAVAQAVALPDRAPVALPVARDVRVPLGELEALAEPVRVRLGDGVAGTVAVPRAGEGEEDAVPQRAVEEGKGEELGDGDSRGLVEALGEWDVDVDVLVEGVGVKAEVGEAACVSVGVREKHGEAVGGLEALGEPEGELVGLIAVPVIKGVIEGSIVALCVAD